MKTTATTIFCLLLIHCCVVLSLIHHLEISKDNRRSFHIESFGFVKGGTIDIRIYDFHISGAKRRTLSAKSHRLLGDSNETDADVAIPAATYKAGFILKKESSESEGQQTLETYYENNLCILDDTEADDILIDMSDPSKWSKSEFSVEISSIGMYSFIFARCEPSGHHEVTFDLHAKFYNPGPNYLSAGDTALPVIYLLLFLVFTLSLIYWCYMLWTTKGVVHRIHTFMTVLLTVKCASLLFESIRYHYIAHYGTSLWSLVYLFFAFVKGVMLFVVIMLIGSGWSLMKSYLNEKEKKIVFFVLVLQVLDNVAMVVLAETSPGSQGWLTWRDMLHLIDIVCCCAILLPIVWSIRHLREAAQVDGKAQSNLMKLQLFRQFYVMVVIYIYFTRIVVYLLEATLPYYLQWLGPFADEVGALTFYMISGYKFRPQVDNPYLPVRSEDMEGHEYGLQDDDGDFELPTSSSGRKP